MLMAVKAVKFLAAGAVATTMIAACIYFGKADPETDEYFLGQCELQATDFSIVEYIDEEDEEVEEVEEVEEDGEDEEDEEDGEEEEDEVDEKEYEDEDEEDDEDDEIYGVEASCRYYMVQLEIAADLMNSGQIDAGLEHLASGLIVYGVSPVMLELLKGAMPLKIYDLLIVRVCSIIAEYMETLEASDVDSDNDD